MEGRFSLGPLHLTDNITTFTTLVQYLVVSFANFALGSQLRRGTLFTICDKIFSIQDTPALSVLPRDELQRGDPPVAFTVRRIIGVC